jgi:hypothetical protein
MEANLTKSVWKGPDVYTKGKERLDMVIREYDQAIMHLTAMVVSSKSSVTQKLT